MPTNSPNEPLTWEWLEKNANSQLKELAVKLLTEETMSIEELRKRMREQDLEDLEEVEEKLHRLTRQRRLQREWTVPFGDSPRSGRLAMVEVPRALLQRLLSAPLRDLPEVLSELIRYAKSADEPSGH